MKFIGKFYPFTLTDTSIFNLGYIAQGFDNTSEIKLIIDHESQMLNSTILKNAISLSFAHFYSM